MPGSGSLPAAGVSGCEALEVPLGASMLLRELSQLLRFPPASSHQFKREQFKVAPFSRACQTARPARCC